MAKDVIHEGSKRWFSDKVDTKCGLVLEGGGDPQGISWFGGGITCPDCRAGRKSGKG